MLEGFHRSLSYPTVDLRLHFHERSGTAGTRQEWPIVGSWASGKVRQLSVPGKKIESKRDAPDIPPKADRRWKNCFSPWLYRRRNAIERMFGRLKDFRRIATRYDRLASNFLAAVCLAATCYWL
jgi:Transposase DDE domain